MDAAELLEVREKPTAGAARPAEPRLVSLRRHALKDVARARELFTLDAPG